MITVASEVLATNLNAYLEEVIGEGKTSVITMNGRPVAELRPPVGATAALYYDTKSMLDDRVLERCRELVEQVELARLEIGRKRGVEADRRRSFGKTATSCIDEQTGGGQQRVITR